MGDDAKDMKFFGSAFEVDDFQGLGRRKIWRLINIFLSEFFGTAILVFLGCATVIGTTMATGIDHFAICAAFGLSIATSVMIFGHISGSHINPALSVAGVVCGKISMIMCLYYTVAQCLGATFGYYLVTAISPKSKVFSAHNSTEAVPLCCSVPNSELEPSQAFLAEALATGILVWALCSAWDYRCRDKHDSLPLKFAAVVIALALPTAIYSGCSVNPARSFGPALITGYWENHWIYWLGPIVGSVIASSIYAVIFQPSRMVTDTSMPRRDSATMKLRNANTSEEHA